MTERPDESDQLPEEGPAEQVPDDAAGDHSERESDGSGAPDGGGAGPEDDPGKATGNPRS